MKTTLVRLTDSRIKAVANGHEIWTTLEGENPGGSIKDRMVAAELESALEDGRLRPGDTVTEISAGSTAHSIAVHSRRLGLKCVLFLPKDVSAELKQKLETLDAELHLCDPTPAAYQAFDEFCAAHPVWRFDQMKRPELKNHYMAWARSEISPQFNSIDYVIAAVGTGHSLLGIRDGLMPQRGAVSAEPLEPRLIHGIRNLEKESFGPQDPCQINQIEKRIVLSAEEFFPTNSVETDQGSIYISDSFRVVLGSIERIASLNTKLTLFAIGSHNRRIEKAI